MLYSNGDEYTGEWKRDLFHGIGTLTYSSRDILVGNFSEGKFEGSFSRSKTEIAVARHPIALIDFKDFKLNGSIPRRPNNERMIFDSSRIDRNSSFIVFLSHCWLRGYPGAPGYDINEGPHPDNSSGEKHKMFVQAIERAWTELAPGMSRCFIWADFSCIDQEGDAGGELKQLDAIIGICDCIATVVIGIPEVSPIQQEGPNHLSFNMSSWNTGTHAYLNRAWCRTEMIYGALVPVITDTSRLSKMSGALKSFHQEGKRPHLLYTTKEYDSRASAHVLSPVDVHLFDPTRGHLSKETDRQYISQLMADLYSNFNF